MSEDRTALELHDTMDATKWAKEFCKRYPSALCQIEGHEGVTQGDDFEHVMVGWFANAIMTGHDHAHQNRQSGTEPEAA